MKLSDQFRKAVDDCGMTRYRIAQETGIDESALCKFFHGQRGLSLASLDALGECLNLTLTTKSKPKTKGSK